ncbi:MAG: PDZ domain-containing protein [Wenzhouxiangella sp.]
MIHPPAILAIFFAGIWSINAAADDGLALRAELEQAQLELAAAAQKVARLSRQLAAHSEAISFSEETNPSVSVVHLAMPPSLGLLLGTPGTKEANRVLGVTPGGSADTAGVQAGDRLIRLAGVDIREEGHKRIRRVLEAAEPETALPLTLLRGEQRLSLSIRPGQSDGALKSIEGLLAEIAALIDQPLDPQTARRIIHARSDINVPTSAWLGQEAELVANHPGLSEYFGTGTGVLLLNVAESNPFGLRPGDVILKVDGQAITRPLELGRRLQSLPAEQIVRLNVKRTGELLELSN